jgi:hypothetical protein
MADKVNFAGYTRPPRLSSGNVSAARLRRAAAANRQPRAISRYQIWNGIDVNSASRGDFEAINVFGSADYTVSLIRVGVNSSIVPYFYMYEGGGPSLIFGVDAFGCQCDKAFNFNTSAVDPSLKDHDARFDGQTLTHVLFVDASKNSVAIGTDVCQASYILTVAGKVWITGGLICVDGIRSNNGFMNGWDVGVDNSASGVPTSLTASGGLVTAVSKTTPVADGTYAVDGSAAGTVSSITIANGIITGITTR